MKKDSSGVTLFDFFRRLDFSFFAAQSSRGSETMTRFPLTVSTVKQMTDLLSSIFCILFCSFDPTLNIPYVYSRSSPLCLFFFSTLLYPFWCFDAHTNSGVWPWTDKQSLSSLFGLDPDGTYLAYTLTVRAAPLLFPPPLSDLQHTPLKREKSELTDCWAHKSREPPFSLDRRKKTTRQFFFLFFSLPGRIINSH